MFSHRQSVRLRGDGAVIEGKAPAVNTLGPLGFEDSSPDETFDEAVCLALHHYSKLF